MKAKPIRRFEQKSLLRTKTQTATLESSMSVFSDMVKEVLVTKGVETKTLGDFWEMLPLLEKNLMQRQNVENLKSYRELIINISRLTLKKNNRVVSFTKRNRHGKKQTYAIIRTLNKKMSMLNQMLFSKNNATFQLYQAFAEIRGLLLDLDH